MKNWLRNIAIIAMAISSLNSMAVEEENDTVYFFNSWDQVLKMKPAAMIVNPYISFTTAYDMIVETDDSKVNQKIEKEYMAELLGGEFWYINTEYLKKNFKGDARYLEGYLPVFFNKKVAYFTAMKEFEYQMANAITYVHDWVYYYYIDFEHRKVRRVDHKVLSDLLNDYHDLQVRYEGMKDYKKLDIIEDYFLEFIDRASIDETHPNILDLVDE